MEVQNIDPDQLLSGDLSWVSRTMLEAFAEGPLESLETEYPHFVGHVEGPNDVEPQSERHPAFYGCYDWHSAVHTHWCLIRQLRLAVDHPLEASIRELVLSRLTSSSVDEELAHFSEGSTFEKPYGWAWLLRLVVELELLDDGTAWRDAIEPLERRILDLVTTQLLPQQRPLRVGTHGNTAFALAAILDYARTLDRTDLAARTTECAKRFYAEDRNAPVGYEPFGWDFLSPSLSEIDLMRRVLEPEAFREWLEAFCPELSVYFLQEGFAPIAVDPDPADPLQIHFVGLNLSRAWCLAGLADVLPHHPAHEVLRESAVRHAEVGLADAFMEDFAGSHWLVSFAVYMLSRNSGGIAPGVS